MGVQRQQKRKPRSNALAATSKASKKDLFFPYLLSASANLLHEHTTIIIHIEPVEGKPDMEALKVALATAIKYTESTMQRLRRAHNRVIVSNAEENRNGVLRPREPTDTEENHRFFHAHLNETGQAIYPGYFPMSYDDIVDVIYETEVQSASFKASKAAIPVKGFPLSRAELEAYFRNDAGLVGNYGCFCAMWRRPDDSILGLPGAMVESEHLKAVIAGQQEAARNRHEWRRNGPDVDPPNIGPPNIDPPNIDPPNDDPPFCEAAEYPSDVSIPSATLASSVHLRPDSDIIMRTASNRSSSEASTIRPNLAVIRAGKKRMDGEGKEAAKNTDDEHFGCPNCGVRIPMTRIFKARERAKIMAARIIAKNLGHGRKRTNAGGYKYY